MDQLQQIRDKKTELTFKQNVQENNLKEAKTREKYYERILGDQISKSALTYLTLQHPHISADEILKANEANNSEVREELNKTCSL